MANQMKASTATAIFGSYVEKGAGRDVSRQRYDQTAMEFDEANTVAGYTGPAKVGSIMAELFSTNRSKIRVFDVAAGTGLAGEQMSKVGFSQIDGVDPSQRMLDLAKERNVYRRLICDFVDDKHQLDIPDNYYDAITICGGMGNNHLPPGSFDEMIRLVKPGGLIVNVTRHYVFTAMDEYVNVLEPYFRKLEASGKWKEESRTIFPNYLDGVDGMALIHKVLV